MVSVDRMDRLTALFEALRAGQPRPEKLAAWFAASTVLTAPGEVEALANSVRDTRDALGEAVGRHASPSGALRWIYAGLLQAQSVEVERFAAARQSLRRHVRGTKTGALHAGGARAALMLCLGAATDTPVDRFFEMKRTLMPPWWRADVSVTDTYAALHAAQGHDPATVLRQRDHAEAVFSEFPRARRHKRDGAKLAVLLDVDPRMALQRYKALEAARATHRALRRSSLREMFMSWAIQGLDVKDVLAIEVLRAEMPRSVSSEGGSRTALASLIYTAGRPGLEGGELAAMSAVIAAQTAVMVAVIAASSTVTTTTATS